MRRRRHKPQVEPLSFVARLKQHHIFRVASGYAVAAYILILVANAVFPDIGFSRADVRYVIAALALLFPVALVLGWMLIPPSKKNPDQFSHWQRLLFRLGSVLAVVIVTLVTISGIYLWRANEHYIKLEAISKHIPFSKAPSATTVITAESIAVLPFANDSGNKDQQYFSDGLSEDLITALSKIAGLKVISRNSSFVFRGSTEDAKTIGAKLGVTHLLEGSVRRDGQVIRVTAELVNVPDGSAQWSQHYDRPYRNLFQLQDDITQAIAGALKVRLLATASDAIRAMRPPSGNLVAYDAWLQGNFYAQGLKESDLRRAIAEYSHAIALDPKYAQAYADRSYAWTYLGIIWLTGPSLRAAYSNARKDARMALSLEPNLAAAHRSLGSALKWGSLDISSAEAEYRTAVQFAPNSAGPRMGLGMALASLGRLDEGIAQVRQAIEYDPLNSRSYRALADLELARGRFDEAEHAIHKAIALRPDAATNRRSLVYIDIRRGDQAAALHDAQQEPDPLYRQWELAMALQIGHDRSAADAALKHFIDKHADLGGFQIAEAYALRKQPSKAFAWLDRSWAVRDPGVMELYYDPFLLAYKHDPRFTAFCQKVGLPTPSELK